jgi:integrase
MPRSDKALYGDFHRWVDAAGLGGKVAGHHLSLHGLRKALGRRLAEAGCTEREIMAVLGHSDPKQVRTYTGSASVELLAESALGKMANISPPETTVVRLKKPMGPKS